MIDIGTVIASFVAFVAVVFLYFALVEVITPKRKQKEAFGKVDKELALKDIVETQQQILEELRQIKDLRTKGE